MYKDFNNWSIIKEKVDGLSKRLFFHEREVWWSSVGLNIGFEQDGKGDKFTRPVLIFKKFSNEVCWALPISTKIKNGIFYSRIFLEDDLSRVVIISQLRLIDSKRLINKVGTISKENYRDIQRAIISLCER